MSIGTTFTADELSLIPKPEPEVEQQTTGQEGAPPAPAPAPASEPPAPAPTEAATPSPAPAPAATPAPPAPAPEPQGDVRAALRAARRGEHRAREEAERLRRENEELLKRVAATPNPDELSDEEIAQLEQDAPVMGKAARLIKKAAAAAAPAPAPAQPEFVPPQFTPEIQEVIDGVPDLLTWQYQQDQSLFQAAVQQDTYLRTLPAWKDKPMAERFAEVVRRVKADSGAPSPAPTPRTDPAAAIAAAPRTTPSTLSDIAGGGGAPQTQASNLERFAKMSEDQILADLARGG